MTPIEEKKLLMQVLKRLEHPPTSMLIAKWFLPVAWILCVAVFFAAFQLGERLGNGVLALSFALLGICIGIVTFARVCARQEPIMRGHIDQASIARRLAELEA